ncbi:MAG: glycosyltransferase family 2 protein [Synechococcales cyanobacterium RM1_1_8]|nr:glycosyltransferase family 2 protein [Synechococcales cyanobacterium RM1_1_8]
MASVPVMKAGWSQPVSPTLGRPSGEPRAKPLVSLVAPAYNEASILEANLSLLCQHMAQLENEFRWEIVVVNDGSRDNTAQIADALAQQVPQIRVVHHLHNSGLGQALRTGFEHSQGDYIVTLDLDLSYSPEHIETLVRRMRQTGAQVVVASPYMAGGQVSNVPTFRRLLSVWANRFLSLADKGEISTLTGMVRAYDRQFIDSLHPRSMGMDINPEILHKAKLLNERVDEVPAHLNWRDPPPAPAPLPYGPVPDPQAGQASQAEVEHEDPAPYLVYFLLRLSVPPSHVFLCAEPDLPRPRHLRRELGRHPQLDGLPSHGCSRNSESRSDDCSGNCLSESAPYFHPGWGAADLGRSVVQLGGVIRAKQVLLRGNLLPWHGDSPGQSADEVGLRAEQQNRFPKSPSFSLRSLQTWSARLNRNRHFFSFPPTKMPRAVPWGQMK